MRNSFVSALTELAAKDERVVLLTGDLGFKLWDDFRERFPDRWYNAGIAEANMVSVAAGLALGGMRPFVYSIATFATYRCFEQIRLDLCYHNLPVVVVGVGGGLSYAKLGPTHHATEDVACMAALPNMTVWCPCDPLQVRDCVAVAPAVGGPLYLRLGKNGEPTLPAFDPPVLRYGTDVCILATGPIAKVALDAAELLAHEGISAWVEACVVVKPLPAERLRPHAERFRLVCTLEEHVQAGGFGEAVWAVLGGWVKMLRFALPDEFAHNLGSRDEVLKACGLTAENIAANVMEALR